VRLESRACRTGEGRGARIALHLLALEVLPELLDLALELPDLLLLRLQQPLLRGLLGHRLPDSLDQIMTTHLICRR